MVFGDSLGIFTAAPATGFAMQSIHPVLLDLKSLGLGGESPGTVDLGFKFFNESIRTANLRGFRSTLKGGMSSSPEIHGFSPGGFQYGVFRISVRIPVFAMAKMGRVSGF